MYSFGIIMDPIEDINPKEDSTFSIITALQKNHNIEYIVPDTIHLINQDIFAQTKKLNTFKRKKDFYKLSRSRLMNLSKLDCILFRKDPPVDEKYIQTTHMLDYLEKNGVLIINSPQSLRDYNEKLLGNNLTKLNLPTLVSSNQETIVDFIKKHKKVVIKPLNLMGGKEISLLSLQDKDLLKSLEKNYKKLGLTRTVYKKGGITITTYTPTKKSKTGSQKYDKNPIPRDTAPAR